MAKAFGIPGLYNTPMKWNKENVNGRQVEWRCRLWHGNVIGYYVKSKAAGIEKQHLNALSAGEAIIKFIAKNFKR